MNLGLWLHSNAIAIAPYYIFHFLWNILGHRAYAVNAVCCSKGVATVVLGT